MSCFGKLSAILACVVIAAIFSKAEAKPPKPIKGGHDAAPGEFPYVVSISRRGSRNYCGGAIITPKHILTAGHCIAGGGPMTVSSGIEHLDDANIIKPKVSHVVLHVNYSAQTLFRTVRNDIGIIVLKDNLTFGERVNKILLPIEEPKENDDNNVFAGWGAISENQVGDQLILHKTAVKLLDDKKCAEKKTWPVRPEMLCGYQDNSVLCGGDSGGPLVSDNRVVGIGSISLCNIGTPTIYTNVYNYLDWINSVITD